MKPCTFVHIGDTHLHPGPRNADRLRALDQIINENIDRPDLAAWLWPGDLFHARSTIEDRNALAERLRLMAGKAAVVMVYGNHDLAGDLDIFAKLATAWPIYVVARPQVLSVPLATGDLGTIFCLPYPNEAGLVSQGVAPGDLISTARQALDAIFMDAAARLATAEIPLAIGHVNVSGAMTSTGQPSIGQEIEIDGGLIARLGSVYVGLNHIHVAQRIAGAQYAGSICRLSWGETEPKSYIRVHYERDGSWRIGEVPLDVAPMFHVEGMLSREGFIYEVKGGDKPASWHGCEVRARLRFNQSEKGILEFQKAHVFAEFAESKRFELELVAVPDSGVRAPEVAAARTLPEKVAAWAVETKTTLPDQVLAVLPSLEHGDAERVIAHERAGMELLLNPAPVVEQEAQAVA